MGILSSSAVSDYLKGSFNNWDGWKRESKKYVRSEIHKLEKRMQWKTQPYLHQAVAFLLCQINSYFLLFLDMGLGKTKIVLDVLTYKKVICGDSGKCLIVVHNEASIGAWVEEIEKHSDFTYSQITGNRASREKAWQFDKDLYLVTYPALVSFVAPLKKVGRSKKKKRAIDIRNLCRSFDYLILDEVHNVKNVESLQHRVCYEIRKKAKYAYGLTGTPMGRDAADLFGECLCIDLGETFGNNFGMFRKAYYTSHMHKKWIEWKFIRKMSKDFHQRVKHRSISWKENECFDVPEVTRKVIRCGFLEDMREKYKDLMIFGAMEGHTIFSSLRQLTGGFYRAEDEDGELLIQLDRSPKIETLMDLIADVPLNSKVVVFYEHTRIGEETSSRLNKLSILHEWLWGGSKNPREVISRFKTREDIRVLLANWRSAGTGLNLQVANYVIFLESPVSPIQRAQAEMRVRPRLQTRTFIYDLVIQNTVDEKILEFLKEGRDLERELINGSYMFRLRIE